MSGAGSVLIVGGGISGLALAHYLLRGGRPAAAAAAAGLGPSSVRLVEASARLGGWVRTDRARLGRHAGGPDVAYETGPRSLNRIRGAVTLELCAELGLAESVIPAAASAAKRYVVGRDGAVQAVPSRGAALVRSALTRSMLPWLIRDLIRPRPVRPHADLSISDFFADRIGPDATSLLVSALAAGIYAGDPNRLSMRSCLPALIDMAEQHQGSLARGLIQAAIRRPAELRAQRLSPEVAGSLARIHERLGRAPIYTLEGGLSTLTDALQRRLRDRVDVQTERKVVSLCPRTLTARTSDGAAGRYDHVFWTGSAGSLAAALSSSAADDPEVRSLQSALGRVQYASVACVTLAWAQAGALAPPDGFGVLVPGGIAGAPPVLGITFDSVTFPTGLAPGTVVMTVMIGGDRDPELARAADSDLVALAQDAVRHLLGIGRKADFAAVNVAVDAIPQFYVGHGQVVDEIRSRAARLHPQLHVAGTAMTGVAINDCIRSGSEIGRLFCAAEDAAADGTNVFSSPK